MTNKMAAKNKTVFIIVAIIILATVAVLAFYMKPSGQMKNAEMLAKPAAIVIETSDINYFDNTFGYLARPKEAGEYPGVVMIHEWWGLNDNIKDMAEQLAAEGYVVLAVDLFEGKVADTPEEARAQVTALDQGKAVENLKAAVAYLREQQSSAKVASLGWCFGGGQSLQLALNDGVDATVIYYGSLVTNESQLASINWPVLGIFGDQDAVIPVSSVNEFDAALDNLGIENEIYIYEGVGHAFANPSGMTYAPEETKDAWDKTLAFLNAHLR